VHQLVIKYFDNSKMHGANVKIVYPQFTDFLTQLSAAHNLSQYMYGFLINNVLTTPYLLECKFLGSCNVCVLSALGQPHATRSHMLTHHRRLIFALANVAD